MKISNIMVFPTRNNKSTIKANGFMTLENCIKIKFLLCESKNGLFVTYPSEKYEKDGETKYSKYVDITDKEAIAKINQAALAAYYEKVGDTNQGHSQEPQSQVISKPASSSSVRKNTIPF